MSFSASAAEPAPINLDRWLTLIAVTYSVFVLYGSLVPLEIRSLGLADAWGRFTQIRLLSLGTVGRADWVANILLYIPLAFFWCASAHARSGTRWGATGFILISCVAFAVLIEFVQVWFPPRTVSQNDLLAEALGSVIGVTIWLMAGRFLIKLARTILEGGRAGLDAAFIAYAGFYCAYSLFPFDFLVSNQELSAKLASSAIAVFITPSCGGVLRCGMNLTLEAVSFVPFGLFMALLLKRPGAAAPGWLAALLWGALAGAVIEGIQIFIASGITQGISIGTRALGMVAGVVIGRAWSATWLTAWLPFARGAVVVGVAGYALLLAAIAWRGGWQADGAMLRLNSLHWLPFYYHYYTTEQNAVLSLLRNAIMYAPVGMAVWVWQFAGLRGHRTDLPGGALVFWLGASLALLMEASRLLKPSGHADPTNLLIAAVAAWLTFRLTAWFAGCLLSDADKQRAGSV
jgi:VanZ family protein